MSRPTPERLKWLRAQVEAADEVVTINRSRVPEFDIRGDVLDLLEMVMEPPKKFHTGQQVMEHYGATCTCPVGPLTQIDCPRHGAIGRQSPAWRGGVCPARWPWIMAHVIPAGSHTCALCEEVMPTADPESTDSSSSGTISASAVTGGRVSDENTREER